MDSDWSVEGYEYGSVEEYEYGVWYSICFKASRIDAMKIASSLTVTNEDCRYRIRNLVTGEIVEVEN